MKRLSYLKQNDYALVFGGGPSIASNRKKLIDFNRVFKPTVFSTHYVHGCAHPNFVFFAGYNRFKYDVPHLKCRNIVLARHSSQMNHIFMKRVRKYSSKYNKNIYLWPPYENSELPSNANILINKDGLINHEHVNCGLSTILAAALCRPKYLLIVGFDGPALNDKGERLYSDKFDGRHLTYPKKPSAKRKDHWDYQRRYFHKKLFKFFQSRGTTIFSFKDDALWGINKKKADIRLYQALRRMG